MVIELDKKYLDIIISDLKESLDASRNFLKDFILDKDCVSKVKNDIKARLLLISYLRRTTNEKH